MKRGSVFWINLEPSDPPEMGKVRPGIIVSNTELNLVTPSVVILPLSSKAPEIWPLRVEILLTQKKSSYAIVPGLRQVAKKRLLEKMAEISEKHLKYLDQAISLYLSD